MFHNTQTLENGYIKRTSPPSSPFHRGEENVPRLLSACQGALVAVTGSRSLQKEAGPPNPEANGRRRGVLWEDVSSYQGNRKLFGEVSRKGGDVPASGVRCDAVVTFG